MKESENVFFAPPFKSSIETPTRLHFFPPFHAKEKCNFDSQVKVINVTNLLNVLSIILRVGNLLFMYKFSSPLMLLSFVHFSHPFFYIHQRGGFFCLIKRFMLMFYLFIPQKCSNRTFVGNKIKIFFSLVSFVISSQKHFTLISNDDIMRNFSS